MKRMLLISLCLVFASANLNAQTKSKKKYKSSKPKGACCVAPGATENKSFQLGDMTIPHVSLLNQEGEKTDLHELVKGKVVVMNFLFTSCTTICPPMGANFTALKQELEPHIGKDLEMISISIDPVRDTPEQLKAWSEKFNAGPGWTLLTGEKQQIDQLLKSLNVFTPLIEDHAPIILMGKEGENNWIRTNGLAPVKKLTSMVEEYFSEESGEPEMAPFEDEQPMTPEEREENDRNWFTETVLIDQNNNELKFYSDLLKDKIVIINCFFSECVGVCPVMNNNLQAIQGYYGDRIGKDINIISISVDAETDSPEILKAYADSYKAKKGWYFLTGEKSKVNTVLSKLGLFTDVREAHKSIMLVLNIPSGLWKKAQGLVSAPELLNVVNSVVYDEVKVE